MTTTHEAHLPVLRVEDDPAEAFWLEERVCRLAGGVADDFGNILTAITIHAEFLVGKLPEDDPLNRRARDIQRAARRGSGLIGQLLAFSRQQVLRPELVSLSAVVAEVGGLFQRILGDEIQVAQRLVEDPGLVHADPRQLEHVILHLVANSKEAMPLGGDLLLATAEVDVGHDLSGVDGPIPPGSYVRLDVADSGEGMDPATQKKIFEPFFTTREGKTGLGLAAIHGIVEQSGGYLSVVSQNGGGTCVSVYLPRVERRAPDLSDRPIHASPGGQETILLVEDDSDLRRLMGEALRQEGYEVLEASSGRKALDLASRPGREPDLVITDFVLPDLLATELLAELRNRNPGLQAIFLSGYMDETTVQLRGAAATRVPFVEKPFSTTSLNRRVREVLDAACP